MRFYKQVKLSLFLILLYYFKNIRISVAYFFCSVYSKYMRDFTYTLDHDDKLEKLGAALANPIRRRILRLILEKSYSLLELAKEMGIPVSTTSFHVKSLREAGLIKVLANPSKRGNEKNISFDCERVSIFFTDGANVDRYNKIIEIPLGSYIEYDITPPCAICTHDELVGALDDVRVFEHPKRVNAQLISFYKGHIVYPIPLETEEEAKIASLNITMEICSECPNYNNSWKSNITFYLDDVELATYLSLGDYGGRRGRFTPSFWGNNSTQYGMLVNLTIDEKGTFLDGVKVSELTIDKLDLQDKYLTKLKIAIKGDAKYVGGINIFGRHFGDYDSDIVVQIAYEKKI